jgi:hypothetical protein
MITCTSVSLGHSDAVISNLPPALSLDICYGDSWVDELQTDL